MTSSKEIDKTYDNGSMAITSPLTVMWHIRTAGTARSCLPVESFCGYCELVTSETQTEPRIAMRLEHPLKKKYDRKCVPVRRVSAWEREQIEKRQKHLKEFKGQKWQKLHREDELRKAKAAAAGIRYVRLSSVRSSSTTPNKVSRVAARRTRGVRFSARKVQNPLPE